jgi:hypothetical protein
MVRSAPPRLQLSSHLRNIRNCTTNKEDPQRWWTLSVTSLEIAFGRREGLVTGALSAFRIWLVVFGVLSVQFVWKYRINEPPEGPAGSPPTSWNLC